MELEKLSDKDLQELEIWIAKSSPIEKWLDAGENAGFGVQFPQMIYRGNHGDYWKKNDAVLIMMMRRAITALVNEVKEQRAKLSAGTGA